MASSIARGVELSSATPANNELSSLLELSESVERVASSASWSFSNSSTSEATVMSSSCSSACTFLITSRSVSSKRTGSMQSMMKLPMRPVIRE